jgi:hypothetical protein
VESSEDFFISMWKGICEFGKKRREIKEGADQVCPGMICGNHQRVLANA